MHVIQVLSVAVMGIGVASLGQNEVEFDECPCGYIGPTCNETGSIEDDEEFPSEVVSFPGGFCSEYGVCVVSSDNEATCDCERGVIGDLCEEFEQVDTVGLAAGIAVPVLAIALMVYLIRRREKLTKGSDWEINPSHLVSGVGSKRVVMIYRIVMFLFSLTLSLRQFFYRGQFIPYGRIFRFFTIWNFYLLVIFFGVGSYLSIKANRSNVAPRSSLNSLEKNFLVLLEIELPSTVLVGVIYWAVLFPSRGRTDFDAVVQHSINILMMGGDFYLTDTRINFYHFPYILIWGSLYVLAHDLWIVIEVYGMDKPIFASYAFLSPTTPLLPVFIIGIAVFLILFYFAVYYTNRFKREIPEEAKTEEDQSKN